MVGVGQLTTLLSAGPRPQAVPVLDLKLGSDQLPGGVPCPTKGELLETDPAAIANRTWGNLYRGPKV